MSPGSGTSPGSEARAQTELGERYEDWRNGVQQDYGVAVSWFRRAADQGFAAGQAALGVCMGNGPPDSDVGGITGDHGVSR